MASTTLFILCIFNTSRRWTSFWSCRDITDIIRGFRRNIFCVCTWRQDGKLLRPQGFSSWTGPCARTGPPFPPGEPEVFPTDPGSSRVTWNSGARSLPCDRATETRREREMRWDERWWDVTLQKIHSIQRGWKEEASYLTKEHFQSLNVVIRKTESFLVLTHDIHFETGLWLLLQVVHACNYFLFGADKLLVAALLRQGMAGYDSVTWVNNEKESTENQMLTFSLVKWSK